MVKKMKFLSFLKNKRSPSSSWGWHYCHQPQTLSFRATKNDVVFKTMNSAYIDVAAAATNTEVQKIPEPPLSYIDAAATTVTNTEIQEVSESVSTESPLSYMDSAIATTTATNMEIQEISELVSTESPLSYVDSAIAATTTATNTEIQEISESIFTESPFSASFSTASEMDSRGGPDPIEILIRGLCYSDRLFFEADKTSSILEANADKIASESFESSLFRNSLVLQMDSGDPYWDFRNSMEEMVVAHGVNTWEDIEELLYLFLKLNEKTNHEYIVDAFVDFLKGLAIDSNDPCSSPESLCDDDDDHQKEAHARAPSFSPWLFEKEEIITPENHEASPSYSNT